MLIFAHRHFPLAQLNANVRVSPIPSTSTVSASALSPESGCAAHCCDLQWDSPNQPTNSSLLAATKRVQGSGKSKQARSVQVGWFKEHPWLSLCETRQRLFCFYCQCADRRQLVTFGLRQVFIIGKRLGKDSASMKEVKYMPNRA